ncbi:hypothetical protein AVEN_252174-1 [Araneus ventricosus]|uniref:Uncharacterized protein n=1 Tax=Araneus ventricosus TaxID=182803 RepID=A0A4Y2MXX6_ARAVE|nr:hypothetical protein AVEN_252174-1 [Araneus ventricosus]
MTRTTPELALPPFLGSSGLCGYLCAAPMGGRMIQRATGTIHGGSSVELCFEPATLRSRGQDLATRPPRPEVFVALLIKSFGGNNNLSFGRINFI